MALLFMDGFDYYSTDGNEGAVGAGWDASPTPGVGNTSSGIYGYGKYSNNLTAYRTIPNTQTVILGFHYFPGGSLGDNFTNWFTFYDGGTTQAVLRIGDQGQFLFYRGNGSALLATGPINNLRPNTWVWLSIKIKFSATVGTIDITLNGVSLLSASGLNNITTANAYTNRFSTARPGNGSSYHPNWDNFHVCDDSGGAPFNAILAERRIYFFMPTGAGTASVWTANGAATFWQCTDEVPSNGDTDYGSSTTPGNRSDVVIADVSGFTVLDSVKTNMVARKDDAGARTLSSVVRQGGTYYDAAAVTLFSTYSGFPVLYNAQPATGAWDVTAFNAAEWGVLDVA